MRYNVLFEKQNKIALNKVNKLFNLLKNHEYNEHDFEYLFIVGGDGNFLKFAANYLLKPVKIILINAGTLGFYSYTKNISDIKLNEILNDKNYIQLDLLNIVYKDQSWLAINDFSIYSNYAINLDLFINKVLIESMKSNGILISTPMGSTARNKSLHGPIVFPDNPVFILSEIEPIHNRYYSSLISSMVIDNKNKIKIKFNSFKKYHLIIDGLVIEKDDDEKGIIEITHQKSIAKLLIKIDTKSWSNKLNYAFKK